MFNVNKQTMYVISDIGSTAVSKKTVEYFSPFEQIQGRLQELSATRSLN